MTTRKSVMGGWGLLALLGMLTWGGLGSPSAVRAQDDAAPAAEAAPAPAAAAPAADQPAEAAPAGKQPNTIFTYIRDSGGIGWLICLLSIVALAMIIECFSNVTAKKILPMDVLSKLEEQLDAGEYEQAMETCQTHDNMLTRVIHAGLAKMGGGYERMAEAMADEGESQATALHQKIGWINLLATVSPSLGLLGTVQGMILAFEVIASQPSVNPADLAGSISVALLTTFEGLCVAIPCSVAFGFFRGRVVRITGAMSTIVSEILDRFRPVADGQ